MTPVIFRTFRNGGDVIALFPTVAHDREGRYIQSYQRLGQHGPASPGLVSQHTRPATAEEIEPLRRELVQIGYDDLHEVRRMTAAHRREMFAGIDAARGVNHAS